MTSQPRPLTPDEIRAGIERWSAIANLEHHPGWAELVRVLHNDKAAAFEILASQVTDPHEIGNARGVIREVTAILNVVESAAFEIEQLNKLEE